LQLLNGEIESAQKNLDEVDRLFPIADIAMRVYFQIAQSMIALLHSDYEQANILLQETLVQAEKLGNRFDYMWARVRFGYLALRRGNLIEARQVFVEAAQEFQENNIISGVVFTLEGMAQLFIANGNPINAAQLIGFADANRKCKGHHRPLIEQWDVDKIIATCIIKMDEAAFSDAYDEGQAMTLDEAVVLALTE
jgi:hypothetical protein